MKDISECGGCKTGNIIFDVDGVLIDSMPIWANSANLYLSEVHGIDAPPEVDKNCSTMSLLEAGDYVRKLYPQITLSARELADGVAEFIRERYWKVPEKPGMASTIKALADKGYKMYLATASEEENVRGALSNLGVWEYFQAKNRYIKTVQEMPTSLKQPSEVVDVGDCYSENYDHFSYEYNLIQKLKLNDSRVDGLNYYKKENTVPEMLGKYRREVSDHVPIRMEMDLKK